MCQRFVICCLFLVSSFYGRTQVSADESEDSTFVNNLLQRSKDQVNADPEKALAFAIQAKTTAEKIDFPSGAAYALKSIGQIYKKQGKYLEALDSYRQSIKIFEVENRITQLKNA